MVLEAVDGGDDLHDGGEEGRLHGLADLCSLCIFGACVLEDLLFPLPCIDIVCVFVCACR